MGHGLAPFFEGHPPFFFEGTRTKNLMFDPHCVENKNKRCLVYWGCLNVSWVASYALHFYYVCLQVIFHKRSLLIWHYHLSANIRMVDTHHNFLSQVVCFIGLVSNSAFLLALDARWLQVGYLMNPKVFKHNKNKQCSTEKYMWVFYVFFRCILFALSLLCKSVQTDNVHL